MIGKILRAIKRKFKRSFLVQKDNVIRFLFKINTLPDFLIIGAQKAGTTAL